MSVRIRAASRADAGPISRVHVDSWRTTYEGIVPAEYLKGLSYRDRESRWNEILTTGLPASRIFVAATESGGVVGFAHGGPEREGNATYRGELYVIYLVQEHQNRGLGRQLVSTVAQSLLLDGLSSILVWVLDDNRRACRFYESMGGERFGRKTVAVGGRDLVEVSYGWRDIASLIVGAQPGYQGP